MKSIFKSLYIMVSLIASACGSETNIDAGSYMVKHEIAFSTDPYSKSGDIFYTLWKVSTEENNYSLSINDGAAVLYGHDVDNKTVFYFNSSDGDECPFYTHIFAELKKNDEGFSGTSTQVYDFCTVYSPKDGILNMESWATEYMILGKPDD